MLRLQNISKSYAGVKALQNVSLEFLPGEVHALCGENGAGKSTLMNIIMGNVEPDAGTILWNGKAVSIENVLEAQRLGIAIVYQERSLANALSIAENIFPVNLPVGFGGLINYPLLNANTRALLDELGLANLSPETMVGKLSVSEMQMVEIARAIAQKPALLILDEPTASLTHKETAILFRIIRSLTNDGTAVIYISHRMNEIKQISQKISVLKDGKYIGTVDRSGSTEQIIRMMVGRDLESISRESQVQNEIKLEANDISGKGFQNISFQLHKGEILGFAGLQGSGKSALAKALFGHETITSGTLLIDGLQVKFKHPAQAIEHHIVYLPEDRKTEGLFMEKSVAENIYVAQLRNGAYDQRRVNIQSKQLCDDFHVRSHNVNQEVRTLSGGNQQKVMMIRCLALKPDVFIVNEPTHGVDAGAKSEIYPLLKNLTIEGKAVLLISSDLPELLLLSDRVVVMHEGKIQGILKQSEATEEKITALASGFTI